LFGANNARIAEAHWKKALTIEQDIINGNLPESDKTYTDLIFNAAKAAEYQPENVKYNHWLNVYRWESISRIVDPNTNEIVISEKALEFVPRIVKELNKVRLLCPTYGAAYCVVGQLELFILDDPNGADHIRRGFKLAPCDPTACFVAGLLDIEEQNIDASFEKFTRAFELDDRFFQSAANVYINNVLRPDLAVTLAGDNSRHLNYVARALADMEEHKDIVEQARVRMVELLKQQCSRPGASASSFISLANIYRREGNYKDAIEHYCYALEMDYGQVQWRYNLANLLAETNEIPQAIHEARICLRLNPEFKPAEKLIADLSVLPGSVTENNYTP
jgi:tetratricopeptide (TPR) repeat protein